MQKKRSRHVHRLSFLFQYIDESARLLAEGNMDEAFQKVLRSFFEATVSSTGIPPVAYTYTRHTTKNVLGCFGLLNCPLTCIDQVVVLAAFLEHENFISSVDFRGANSSLFANYFSGLKGRTPPSTPFIGKLFVNLDAWLPAVQSVVGIFFGMLGHVVGSMKVKTALETPRGIGKALAPHLYATYAIFSNLPDVY